MDSQKLSQNDWLPQASQRSPRYLVARGVAVLAVIICLIIVASLGGALVLDLKTGWEDYRQSRLALQADWLIASAIDRVRSQLLTNPDYPGETWKINAEKLGCV
jgi:type II secretory pathway component PulK